MRNLKKIKILSKIGLFIFIILATVIHSAYAAGTIIITPDNPNGWWFYEETPTGSGTFTYGPLTPPLGGGSMQLTVNGTGGEIFGTFAFVGTRLDAITSLSYSTYRSIGSSALAPSLQLDIDTDVTDTNTAWQGRLVYEPYYITQNVLTGAWQTWNTLDNATSTGNWWFTRAPGNAICSISSPCTWAKVLANFPNAGIRSAGANTGALQFKAGGGWAGGFVGNVDAFSIGVNNIVTTYDFELPYTVPTTVSISPNSKLSSGAAFTLTMNGTNFFPASIVQWNSLNRPTTFISPTQLTASISSADLVPANTIAITVVNPTPGGGVSNAQLFTIIAPTRYTAWIDHGVGYTDPLGSAYYPSVVYDKNGFGAGVPQYKMWYSDGNGPVYLTASSDGATWGTRTTLTGVSNASHVQVLYDSNCFGAPVCNASAIKYKIWFWDMGAPTIYSISSMAVAESADGIIWVNKTSVVQNSAAKLVQDPDTGLGWNRGTYGPVNIFYQAGATNTGVDPWGYRYVMYYDGTDGGHEVTGLAYSSDGVLWSAYSGNPVLSGSTIGAWDCWSSVYGTVYKDTQGFHYFYSGKGQDNGSGGCMSPLSNNFNGIGHAFSSDGKTWVKDAHSIFEISDGVLYRSGRIYTPSVIDDGSGTLRMYSSVMDSAGVQKKIGYATLSILATTSAPVVSSGGGNVAPTKVIFSGRAYPNSSIEIFLKSNQTAAYRFVPQAVSNMSADGNFDVTYTGLFGGDYIFGLQARDKDGRKSGIVQASVDLLSADKLILQNIFLPPTISLLRTSVRAGDFISIAGYATTGGIVEAEIDGKISRLGIIAGGDGYYKALLSTAQLSYGTHTIRVRQKSEGEMSDFSSNKIFTVSKVFFPMTDLNNDGRIDISDWSIFLSLWISKDDTARKRIDFNGDGKVDIADFSIFMQSLKQ